MKKISFPKDYDSFWNSVSKQDEKWRKQQSRLPFIDKLKILDELYERAKLLRGLREHKKVISRP